MAAYAALVSLMNTVDDIYNHPHLSTSLDKHQIKTLEQKANFLLDFTENSHGVTRKELAQDLESQIASAAHAAEVVIESHIADRIYARSIHKTLKRKKEQSQDDELSSSQRVVLDLQKIMEEDMDSIMEKVIRVKEERGFKDQQLMNSLSVASSRSQINARKASMVGFEGYFSQLLDWLTGQQSERQIITITGMGGIGKTTLARNTYEDSLIVYHFDKCAWVTVSQEYCVTRILLEILFSLGESVGELDEDSPDELGGRLYRILFGRRYLIILDDMWSIEVWEKVKSYFPQNNNRSRIVVTTRQSDVANCFGSSTLALSHLDDDKSWELFCEKAFAQEDCPLELEGIGRNIVKKCRGLPLSIVVIAGVLGKSSRTQEHWEGVENNLRSILNSADNNQCLKILSLSYSYLPACLKPCFLYFGIFPEDAEIFISRLIKFWVAEGFLKQSNDQSLEEVAEGYINDLVDRSLILVHRIIRSNWEHRICKVHDLQRELCIDAAKKENFFCVMNRLNSPQDGDREDCSVFYKIILLEQVSGSPRGLSLSVKGESQGKKSELWRILISTNDSIDSLNNTCAQVSLRFIEDMRSESQTRIYKLPSLISHIWNLQTLNIPHHFDVVAPSEIWEMPQLRHVKVARISLPDPPLRGNRDHIVLRNLHTLGIALNFRCSEEVCKRIPNIKKLKIDYDAFRSEEAISKTVSYYCLYNISRFNKLKSLCYRFFDNVPNLNDLVQNLKFPSSLKQLTLDNCKLHWDDLTTIGSLPFLEALNLKYDAAVGSEWNPTEGAFLRLKVLAIYSCDLIYWNADSSHFPILEELHLVWLYKLNEIPLGIGEISTLGAIFVDNCSASLTISALKILEEQESFGNDSIKVVAQFCDEDTLEEVKERVELEGFPTHNFKLYRGGIPTRSHFGSTLSSKMEIF